MRSGYGLALLLILALPMPAAAQATPEPPERTVSLLVFGNDPCPRSTDREIVVCARLPESERYRIPRSLRRKKDEPAAQSWVNRARELEFVSRAGTPNSCSPVGSGGQTGCFEQFLRIAREERLRAKSEAATFP